MSDSIITELVPTGSNENSSSTVSLSRKSIYSSCSDIFYVGTSEKKTGVLYDKCPRCGQTVYPFEKIGPIKGQVYHRVCFKCIVCGRQLDLRTYFTNSDDLDDKQIYCRSHFPKSNRGHVNADNFHIRNVMKAPKPLVITHLNLPKPTVDSQSVGILHAVNAQNLLHNGKVDQSGHHFPVLPPEIIAARKQIYQLQRDLEIKQKQEEDALYKRFLEERKREEERIERELDNEWKMNLKELCQKYENMGRSNNNPLDQALTSKFQQEKNHLQVDLTLKMDKRRRTIKECLLEQERNETAELVTKQSEEMLKMIERKQVEIMKSQGIKVSPRKPPAPQPPTTRKCHMYESTSVLEYIDNWAIQVAESEQDSYTELVEKLTGNLITDLEKARAIFRWITVKDLNSMEFSESLTEDSPMGILRGIKYGTETYHTLFMRLCSYAGLYCVNIKGHSKSFGYEPGLPIEEGKFLNTWNAVLIDNEWRFVQCNWGARHLVMCKDTATSATDLQNGNSSSSDKIEYEYDEHYFLTDPDEFIFEFFPFEPAWQLLPNPISLSQFEQLPFVRSLFFHYSLDFVNQKRSVVIADERGACDIQLRMPDHLRRELVFHSQLREADDDSSELDNNPDSIKLENFVLHTVERDIVSFNVHLPKRNAYHLELFANTVKKGGSMFGQTFKLRCVCKYKLVCRVLKQRMHALPQCANGEWGPEKAIRHYDWKALSHRGAIIETVYDDLCVLFELPKRLKVHCRLQSGDAAALSKCPPVHVTINPDNLLIINVRLPVNAQYGLDIYARDPEEKTERKVMSHCCKYLINRSNSFPHVQIGEGMTSNKLFVPVSHGKPDIELEPNATSLNLSFMVVQTFALDFCLKFEGETDGEALPLQDHLAVKRIGNNVVAKVHVPLPGRYLLTIFILTKNGEVRAVPAFTYAIKRKHK